MLLRYDALSLARNAPLFTINRYGGYRTSANLHFYTRLIAVTLIDPDDTGSADIYAVV